ncbi:MAG: dihydrodipicolinate synthase family protein [Rhodospirillaceae bacterium]|jgi:1-pyrroline-4-hydroxy-2-carboxylate deaminase|nr:dihydrodipicolinate synthase family protein [Rhodospirillaceae bacterium]MBT6116303.1 dihydrodipicolinate synthase family protein [Rhodospirillaceae bacterium]
MQVSWTRIFPAVITPFREDLSIDIPALEKQIDMLIGAGCAGISVNGSVGENYALTPEEKRLVVKTAVQVCAGRVPMVAGVAELTTDLASGYARDVAEIGADGLMVLPALVYKADSAEAIRHYRGVAAATDLPIMIYNNPPAYGVDLLPEHYAILAEDEKFVAIKESAADITRLPETIRLLGDRYIMFVGIDDFLLEGVVQGATAYVCGFVNAFPREIVALFDLARAGRWEEAKAIYRWIQPIFAFDHDLKFVQCIKLCMELAGMGSERVRPPRYMIDGQDRKAKEAIIRGVLESRPAIPEIAKAAE